MSEKFEAILLCNPVTNYLSIDVYCCFIRKIGLRSGEDFLKHLNLYYYTFTAAVNLVAIGEVEDFARMSFNKSRRINNSFPSLSKAKEVLDGQTLYLYDMSEKKYKWIKL